MEIYEISGFVDDIDVIETFLAELAARNEELRNTGLGRTKAWESYNDANSAMGRFEKSIYSLIRISKFIDRSIYERLTEIVEKSEISRAITSISVTLKIAEIKDEKPRSILLYTNILLEGLGLFFAKSREVFFSPKHGFTIDNGRLSLTDALVALRRIKSASEELQDAYYDRRMDDVENFKPSNINIENISIYIDNSINIINDTSEIGPETKKKLLEYLNDIKTELAANSPQWRKVVGALVIIAAILGGVAAVPQALENVQAAVKEILGTSIEDLYPSRKEIAKLPDIVAI